MQTNALDKLWISLHWRCVRCHGNTPTYVSRAVCEPGGPDDISDWPVPSPDQTRSPQRAAVAVCLHRLLPGWTGHGHTGKSHRWMDVLCWRSSLFLMSRLFCVVQGGLYVFQIYDHFSCSGASLLLLSIFQSLAIGWVYGTNPNSSLLLALSSPVFCPHDSSLHSIFPIPFSLLPPFLFLPFLIISLFPHLFCFVCPFTSFFLLLPFPLLLFRLYLISLSI